MTRMFTYNGKRMKVWNLFTGCNFNCSYCVSPDSRVLMSDFSWKPIGNIGIGEQVLSFDENVPPTSHRGLRIGDVTHIFHRRVYSSLFTLNTGVSEIIVTGNHPWLQDRGYWVTTEKVAWEGSTLRSIGITPNHMTEGELYRLGYLRGICDGDATLNPIYRDRRHPSWFRLALIDFDALDYVEKSLSEHGIDVPRLKFNNIGKSMEMLQTQSQGKVAAIVRLLEIDGNQSTEYCRGWLAGIFDAEGTLSSYIRIANHNPLIRKKIIEYSKKLGIVFIEESVGCRFVGRVLDFISLVKPKIKRKTKVDGYSHWGLPQKVALTPRKTNQKGLDVVNLETTTSTYICEGLASHNCWARKLAEGRLKANYPNGFIPTIHPDRFTRRFKPDDFVFPVSMGDIAFAPFLILHIIIKCAQKHPATKFLLCSKNPARYKQLAFCPDNVYLGTTLETTETFAVSYAPVPRERYHEMMKLYHQHKFVSIEPLMDFDLKQFIWWMEDIKPEIIEVGADNYHNNLPEPEPQKVRQFLYHLKQICPIVIEKQGLERLK